jgi:hypothetical protein
MEPRKRGSASPSEAARGLVAAPRLELVQNLPFGRALAGVARGALLNRPLFHRNVVPAGGSGAPPTADCLHWIPTKENSVLAGCTERGCDGRKDGEQ